MSEDEQMYPETTRQIAEQRNRLAPGPAEAFRAFSKSVFADGAIAAKTKQLIAVAVAHANRRTGKRISLFHSGGGGVWPRRGRGDGGRNSGLGLSTRLYAGAGERRGKWIFDIHRGRNDRSDSPDREPGSEALQAVGAREFFSGADGRRL